jgi:uncharacterized membrane protein
MPCVNTTAALRRAFIAASVTWAAALPAAAFMTSHAVSSTAHIAAAGVYAFASLACHQIPTRSFTLWGRTLPVCARCTGIYVGAALIGLAASAGARYPFARGGQPARVLLAVAVFPTLATIAYEWTVGDMPSNIVRAITGFLLGAAASAVVLAAADDQVN